MQGPCVLSPRFGSIVDVREALARFWREEDGSTITEYALLASVFAIIVLVAVQAFADSAVTVFTFLQTSILDATS